MDRQKHYLRTSAEAAAFGLAATLLTLAGSGCGQSAEVRAAVPLSPTPEPTRPPIPTLQAIITMGPVVTKEKGATPISTLTKGAVAATETAVARITATPYPTVDVEATTQAVMQAINGNKPISTVTGSNLNP